MLVVVVLLAAGIGAFVRLADARDRAAEAQWQTAVARDATVNATLHLTPATATAAAPAVSQSASPVSTTVTAASLPTATPVVPTATPASPTATTAATTAPSVILPPAGQLLYETDFTKWPSGESTQDAVRGGYDAASKTYLLALTDPTRGYGYWLSTPDGPQVADFRLDVDVRRVAGPDKGIYGVIFRVQAQGLNDKTAPRYNFIITPATASFGLTWTDSDDVGTAIAHTTISTAIRKGDTFNHLTVIAQGATITLGINDVIVGSYQVEHTAAGKAGLIVLNPSNATGPAAMAAAFANFRLAQPSPLR